MRLLIGAVALFFAFTFVSAAALGQQAPNQVSNSGTGRPSDPHEMIVSLLQQSHDLNRQLSPLAQSSLIRDQIDLATQVQPEFARQWANELFVQTSQDKNPAAMDYQAFAVTTLARLDPDRDLQLLHAMDWTTDAQPGSPFPPGMALMRQVFVSLAERDGESALPTIEQEADFIASKATYPYAAVEDAASATIAKDWGENSEHALKVQQSTLDMLLSKYRAAPHSYGGDLEFGEMLKHLGSLPVESIKPALHLLANNLLATDTSKNQYHATVYTSDGQSIKADNAIDAAFLWFAWLFNRDPELIQQLQSGRPGLRDIFEHTKEGTWRSGSFGGITGPAKPHPADPIHDSAMDAMRLARTKPEVAIAKAESLPPGSERSHALLYLARSISTSSPDRAAQLIAEATAAGQENNVETQLDVASVKASIAAGRSNQAELRTLLQSAFDLATRFLSADPKPFADGLGGLVQLGIQHEPDLTVTFLQGLPSCQEKAHLLLAAAQELQRHQLRPSRAPTPITQ